MPCATPLSIRWRQPKFWLTSRWQTPLALAPGTSSASPWARHCPVQYRAHQRNFEIWVTVEDVTDVGENRSLPFYEEAAP